MHICIPVVFIDQVYMVEMAEFYFADDFDKRKNPISSSWPGFMKISRLYQIHFRRRCLAGDA